MAEPLTIDTTSLTKSAYDFGDGMVALLDTELEYIEYLRDRNAGTVLGGIGQGPDDLIQLDYAQKYRYQGRGFGWPRIRPRRPRKPRRKPGMPRTKLNRFMQHRHGRRVVQSLNKMGLRGEQITLYRQLRSRGISVKDAMIQARKAKPGGNVISRGLKYMADMVPNRPRWMTRADWGALRPGVRERLSQFFGSIPEKMRNSRFLKGTLDRVDDAAAGLKKRVIQNIDEFLPIFKVFYKGGAGKFIKKIPFGLGAILDAVILVTLFKEPVGKAIFKAAGGTLGSWAGASLAAAAGSVIPFFGTVAGGILGAIAGGWAGDALGGFIYDMTVGKMQANGGQQDGNTVTNKLNKGGVGGGTGGSVITAPTRGMFGGNPALIGEANEPELVLPMSKIGDAISAVYREGASVMVGATLAFLGPLSSGSAAAASLLSETRRVADTVGARKDVKVAKVKLPNLPPIEGENKEEIRKQLENTESIENITNATGSQNASQNIKVAGQAMWKTILPEGQPIFSSPYGMRGSRMHRGIDIGVWEESPVHSQEDGVVEQIIPEFGEYGGAVVVVHKDGTANLYGHVEDFTVKAGQKVLAGDQLAEIAYYPGDDGSNQSHLHFERFNKSGNRIDPMPYFSQGGVTPSTSSTNIESVNEGGAGEVFKNISSVFVNLKEQVNSNKQELIDTPVNQNNQTGSNVVHVPVPSPYPVPVVQKQYIPMESEAHEQRMVIDVFGKGAGRL